MFQGKSLLDDFQTLNEVRLDAESEVSVVYTSNKIEAASINDVNSPGFFGVMIPPDVTEVSKDAFRWCQTLVKVFIPDSVTSIRDHAFAGCWSLKSIKIPDSVTSIGENAFFWVQFFGKYQHTRFIQHTRFSQRFWKRSRQGQRQAKAKEKERATNNCTRRFPSHCNGITPLRMAAAPPYSAPACPRY